MSSSSYARGALNGFGNETVHSLLHLRSKSLLRANLLVLASFAAAFWMSGFPDVHTNPWMVLPLVVALAGSVEAVRCMRRVWNFYHGAVMISLYMHLMVDSVIFFLLAWPYTRWFL